MSFEPPKSSLKKTTEEMPPPRRVSFAANSTVKPFVNDGDQTIWDNTYEEELNSASSLNKLEGTRMTADMSFTCRNFGTIVDQENIPPTANRIILEQTDMKMTADMSFTCSNFGKIVDQENIPPTANRIVLEQTDMKMTADMSFTCCNFDKIVDQENIPPTANRTVLEQIEMEYTCQIEVDDSKEAIQNDVANQTMFPQDDMSFTCNFSEVQTMKSEVKIEECQLENCNSMTKPEVKIDEACINEYKEELPKEEEMSLDNIITRHANDTLLEEQNLSVNDNLVNLSNIEAGVINMSLVPSTSNAQSTIDNTQALIDAASSSMAMNSSMNQMMRSLNNILGNYKLVSYKPVKLDLTESYAQIKKSQDVLKKIKECLTNYQPPTSLEFQPSFQSSTSTGSDSNNLTSTDNSEQPVDVELDHFEELPNSVIDQIREVFNHSDPANLKLIEMEENTIFFNAFSESIWFRADLHEENDSVIGLSSLEVLKEVSGDPHHLLCKFLVEHLMSKTQMEHLTSSLGHSFDMLSLLEYLDMIIDKCFAFFWMFLMLQREYPSLKIDNETFTFDIVCSRSQTWWTIEFKMSSPEQFQLDSLKVTSKWSDISSRQEHLTVMMRNMESGTECLKNFIKSATDYFQRTIQTFPSVNVI